MLTAIYNHYRLIFKPWVYHRDGYRDFFFEGWFYKLVNRERTEVVAIIPAVVKGDNPKCFIQLLDGSSHRSAVVFEDISNMQAAKQRFEVKIGENYFSMNGLQLNIKGDINLSGSIKLTNHSPFQPSALSPNIMGWYSYVPLMECNHAILSMSSEIEGELVLDGRVIDFTGGKAYLEKDWGSSFPEGYIWCQSNHFNEGDTSFMFSVAKIPWLFSSFTGFLSVFHHGGKQYNFATWNGSKITHLKVTEEKVEATLQNGDLKLEFTIDRAPAGELIAPYIMNGLTKVTESLTSTIHLTLKKGSQTLFSGTGTHTGLDINGRLECIVI